MRRSVPGILLVGVLVVAGCSAPAEEEPEPTPTPSPTGEAVPVLEVGAAGPWVQDLWVFDYVATLDPDGAEVDLTEQVLSLLPGDPDRSVALPHGATFDVHEVLAPWISGPDGAPRTDVDAVAGVLRTPDGDGIAVLATPNADAGDPVGLDDHLEIDLSYLGPLLAPGDPLVVDHGFLQALPGEDPVDADALDLLVHRMEAGRVQYLGEEVDGEHVALAYQSVIGEAVEGSTRGKTPAKARPTMDGFEDGVSKCRGGLRCVRQFFKKFGDGARSSNRLIECNLTGNCLDPLPPPEPPCFGSECGKVRGDPHLTTFDGASLSMQGVGEFVAVRTEGLEVQLRTAPLGSSRTVSIVTGVAVDVGGARVVVGARDRVMEVSVDGSPVDRAGEPFEVSGGTVRVMPGMVQVRSAGGHLVTVNHMWSQSLDVTVALDAQGVTGDVVGLLGNADGDPADDLRTREGQVLEQPLDAEEMYGVFAESWRISDEESLFDYAAGETTETFTDRTFPDAVVTVETLPAAERARAEAVCRAAGIVDETVLRECILDFAVSGNIGFVRSAQRADIVEGVAAGRFGDLARGSGGLEPEDLPLPAAWSATASQREVGERFAHRCPAGGTTATVWGGDGIYTDDSSICTAAVHAGLITVERGGVVLVEKLEGRPSYAESSTRNGITTRDWSTSWSGSFSLERG